MIYIFYELPPLDVIRHIERAFDTDEHHNLIDYVRGEIFNMIEQEQRDTT